MSTLVWIVVAGLLMSAIALVGVVTLLLPQATLQRILLPMVGLAAGSLLGGAFFHMLPGSVDALGRTGSPSMSGWWRGSSPSSSSSSSCTGTTATAPTTPGTGPSAT
jgi:hypothetical protein